jgi:hypothetical protein
MMIMVAAPVPVVHSARNHHHLTYGMAGSRRWGCMSWGFDMGSLYSPILAASGTAGYPQNTCDWS